VCREAQRRDLPGSGEQRQSDREIEARALLPQCGRRKIDRDDLAGPFEQRRVDAASHAMLRLLAGTVCEADDRERGLLPRAQVRLDLDLARLEADERERDRAAEHVPTVRRQPLRVCASSAPEA
jgi:hypothetical protein